MDTSTFLAGASKTIASVMGKLVTVRSIPPHLSCCLFGWPFHAFLGGSILGDLCVVLEWKFFNLLANLFWDL